MAGRICGDRHAPLNISVPGDPVCSEQRKDYSALTRSKVGDGSGSAVEAASCLLVTVTVLWYRWLPVEEPQNEVHEM